MDDVKGKKGSSRFGVAFTLGAKLSKGTTKLARRGVSGVVTTLSHATSSHGSENDSDCEDDELRDAQVMELFRGLSLQGGSSTSQLVALVSKGRLASEWRDTATSDQLVGCNWFRVVASGSSDGGGERFEPLFSGSTGTTPSTYQPSADDVGCRISVQCFDVRSPAVCRFAEVRILLPFSSLPLRHFAFHVVCRCR